MGLSRDTFYRYQAAVETGGVDALIEASRRKPNPKNRIEEASESAVTAFALEQPVFWQVKNFLRNQHGIIFCTDSRKQHDKFVARTAQVIPAQFKILCRASNLIVYTRP